MTAEAAPAGTKILRLSTVAHRSGKSPRQIWRDVKAGRFPKPVRIGQRAVGWYEHEIDAYNLSRPVV